MATQLDIIRSQAASAARNASARARSELRRETSLVNQASRWAGRAAAQGEAALRGRGGGRRGSPPAGAGRSATPRPARPAPDGYVRRSPVQPLRVAEGYRRRQVLRGAAAAALIAAVCAGICMLGQLGIFGR